MTEFGLKTTVHFGQAPLSYLDTLKAQKIFIVTDPFMVESKMADRITERLTGKEVSIFSNVVPDPPMELVVQGVNEVIAFRPDLLIALGGGSAIDDAKAIMQFSRKIGDLPDMDFIAVPTTSGTGSEVTSFAVITDREKGRKYPLVAPELLPDVAILDSDLVKSVPPGIVADTGIDVLTHALEAYVSQKANFFTDAFAEKAVLTVFQYLLRSFESKEDTEAREQMHYASCMAGMAFDQTSLGVNHGIAHNIGGRFKVPHGRANGILLPHIVEYNADLKDYQQKEYCLAARKYARLAELLGIGGVNVRTGVRNLISHIRKLEKALKMPQGFHDCKIAQADYQKEEETIAAGALADGCTATNPRPVTRADVIKILRQAW